MDADTPLVLPDDVPALQRLVRELLAEVQRLRQENAELRARLDGQLRHRFGPRSERVRVRPDRAAPDDNGPATPGHGRRPLPEHLPRKRIEHDLTESERLCPCCGRIRVCIGEQTSEQLDYQPASYFVLVHARKSYACRHCDDPDRFTTAGPSVVGPIPKGLAGAGLLAHLIVSKYGDHLPLHRLESIVRRSGVELSRSTLCDWMAQAATLLGPLVALMRTRLLAGRVIHSDDTPVPFRQTGQDKTLTGHLWVYIGDRDHPYTVFDFTTHYRRDGPGEFLKGYKGYLQADGLAQYEGLFGPGKVTHVACNAHARRKFVEAQSSSPAEAETALGYFRKLYAVERELAARFASDDEAGRQEYRESATAEVREAFHAWLLSQQTRALPKSPLGVAVAYALSLWSALMRYVQAGYLSIDNNLSERTLRGVAVGRKNWLFCGSAEGGKTAAVLYSVVGTCKHLGIDPFAYLREALMGLFVLGGKATEEALGEWLPDVWQRRAVCLGASDASAATVETATASAR